MFSYMIGSVEQIDATSIVLECNGIGYFMHVSSGTISKLSHKEEVKIYTHLSVREDAINLYGFALKEEYDMFITLTGITGIGAKAALSLLSSLSPSQITLAVVAEDYDSLSRAQGIGKKTAQRIVMELKDKIKGSDAISTTATTTTQSVHITASSNEKHDAVEALTSLGYGRSEAVRAVLEIAMEGMNAEQIIKAALKKLSAF